MLNVKKITLDDFEALRTVYGEFQKVAQSLYDWPLSAVDFNGLKRVFAMGAMSGYLMSDVVENQAVGFLFYNVEAYQALEIKVIYMDPTIDVKTGLDTLMSPFMEDAKAIPNWDVMSYPILGEGQARYIRFITWYGFKPIGQAVVKFNLLDGISIEVLQKQDFTPLPPGYRFINWDPQYEAGVVDVLAEAFHSSVDALWDPRFRTVEGMKEAVSFVQSGMYGVFWPSCTTILLNDQNIPKGVCLFNLVSMEEANIPLIGLAESERKHKLGRTLLANTVINCVKEVVDGKINTASISATVATGNVPAIKMYRYSGFIESNWYPHVYQDYDAVLKRKAGQWC